jgi:hypothetical protein
MEEDGLAFLRKGNAYKFLDMEVKKYIKK